MLRGAFCCAPVIVTFYCEQFFTVHALQLTRGDAVPGDSPWKDRIADFLAPRMAERLASRLYFLCHRFRPEVPRWQFVVVIRQVLLTMTSFTGRIFQPGTTYRESTSLGRAVIWLQVRDSKLIRLPIPKSQRLESAPSALGSDTY